MTTLIAVYNSEGCVGRCDARCYEATSPDCECICGGKNHGAGKQQAVENTSELAGRWLERSSAPSGFGLRVQLGGEVAQGSLL